MKTASPAPAPRRNSLDEFIRMMNVPSQKVAAPVPTVAGRFFGAKVAA